MAKTFFFFDLDGTLIDNASAIREAYRHAGVVVPKDAIGKPRGDWCTDEQHAAKNAVYSEMLARYAVRGPALPLWNALVDCAAIDDCYVLTGASRDGAFSSLAWLGIGKSYLAAHGLSLEDKIAFLTEFQIKTALAHSAGVNVFYVDTDPVVWEITQAADCYGVQVG